MWQFCICAKLGKGGGYNNYPAQRAVYLQACTCQQITENENITVGSRIQINDKKNCVHNI